ncbi:MAG TPA: prolyl oligopeptidase family serine peptidase [Thermoanaerobaculia bacterium]|nr:prolyl oligopeptidase family serine peptidase [Thermoanaerobaculia bacterium]
MQRKLAPFLLFVALAAPPLRAAEQAATNVLAVPETITATGVPPIPLAHLEGLLPYENIRGALVMDWHPRERRLLIRTRFAESPQLHEVAAPLGARTQLTFFREPVSTGSYRPGNPNALLYSIDEGGAENYQLFLLDRKTGKARRLSDGTHRYVSPLWSHDGRLLAYASNARNGRDMDVYVADPEKPGSERRLAEVQGSWSPLDWSPDGKRLLASENVSANESYLHWLDVATGERHTLTPKAGKGEPTVSYQGGRWSADGQSVYAASDKDSEFLRLVRLDAATGAAKVLSGDVPWDVEELDRSDDGKLLAYLVNEDGISRLHLIETATGKALPLPELPAGSANGLQFRPHSHEVAFAVSWARSSADVYSYDPEARHLERWTASEVGGLDPETFSLPRLVRYPTFDKDAKGAPRTIPAFVYLPPRDRFPGKRPVVINIHGGPEGQARPAFLGSNNYILNELGAAVIVPNVRGSSGYGKTYLKLDNGRLREDSVKDIGALLDWIATQPELDASRVMVTGGSYGGYMVLAVMTHYSDRLACAWESVGISNFVTFLENTQEYRRDLRRVEYGDERDPQMRAFLEDIAPVNHADKITKPLMISQGANDPRVPLHESDQIAAAVRAKGVPVWYLVAKDEGHGFQKKSNADYQRAVLLELIRTFLLK